MSIQEKLFGQDSGGRTDHDSPHSFHFYLFSINFRFRSPTLSLARQTISIFGNTPTASVAV